MEDHPLYESWTVWYLIPDRYTIKNANWEEFLHPLEEFSTVERFWEIFNSIEKAPNLPKGCRYCVFKRSIVPLWEDARNQNGFEISIEHNIKNAKRAPINEKWMNAVMAVIGETVPEYDYVNGVEFTIRVASFKLCIWTKPCPEGVPDKLAQFLKEVTGWESKVTISPIKIDA